MPRKRKQAPLPITITVEYHGRTFCVSDKADATGSYRLEAFPRPAGTFTAPHDFFHWQHVQRKGWLDVHCPGWVSVQLVPRKVEIHQRVSDYMVKLPDVAWGCGPTVESAIASFLRTAHEELPLGKEGLEFVFIPR